VDHQANLAERANILQWVAIHDQHIGDLARLERAQLVPRLQTRAAFWVAATTICIGVMPASCINSISVTGRPRSNSAA